jgi:hypothetical protein
MAKNKKTIEKKTQEVQQRISIVKEDAMDPKEEIDIPT